MNNIMSFDIEDWYHSNLDGNDPAKWDKYESRVMEPTLKFVEMLDVTGNKGTFFILGKVAEKYPEMVLEIRKSGHEIASHSYDHQLIYDQTVEQFAVDLKKSVDILEGITGEKVVGYRAPSWSIGDNTPWVWEIFKKNGIQYDASLYPYKTYLYGSNENPRFSHEIKINDNEIIQEVPPSVIELFSKRIPFCGGFFLRALPYWFIKWCIKKINESEKQPAIMYLHPWEIDVLIPKLNMGRKENFIKYVNINKAEAKLKKMLEEFSFVSVREFLESKGKLVKQEAESVVV